LEPIDDAPDPKPLVSITKLLALIDFFSFLPSKFTQVNNSSIEMV
jgi:Ca2+-binding EF-hand superfamily protein